MHSRSDERPWAIELKSFLGPVVMLCSPQDRTLKRKTGMEASEYSTLAFSVRYVPDRKRYSGALLRLVPSINAAGIVESYYPGLRRVSPDLKGGAFADSTGFPH